MSITEKPKDELQEIASQLKIPGYKKLSKVELVAAIISTQNKDKESKHSNLKNFWDKYANHIYGLASLVGLILAVIAFFPSDRTGLDEALTSEKGTNEHFIHRANSIAVLPFQDMSPGKNQEFFGDGLAEEIINTLSKLSELDVTGRTSSFSFKGKDLTIDEIGQKLNVKYILEGSIRKSDDKVRITAQLTDANSGFHLCSESFDRNYSDIFNIQDELSEKIGSLILGELTPGQIDKITNNSNIDPDAFELFLEAKSIHLNQFYNLRQNEFFIEAEEKFKKAIEIEPNYALAHAGLADLYDTKRYILRDSIEKKYYEDLKIKFSKKAMELNPNLPYVQLTQGWVYLNRQIREIDFNGAYTCFRKAYELDKRNTDGLEGLFWLYERFDLIDDCSLIMDKMLELSPNETRLYDFFAEFYRVNGDFDKTIELCKKGLLIDEHFVTLYHDLAIAYFFKNENQLSLEAINKISELNPEFLETNERLLIIEAILLNDLSLAERISPRSWTLLYHKKDFDQLDSLLLNRYIARRQGKNTKMMSDYTAMTNHPYYKNLLNNPAFELELEHQIQNKNKAYEKFPRANSFLLN